MEAVVVFEAKQYMVIWRQLEMRDFNGVQIAIRAIVRLMGVEAKSGESYVMDVMFLSPESAVPQPTFEIEQKKGYMFMPISDIAAFVDILRNEKPIFGHLRADKPEWTSVTTAQEDIGEGESAG
jgi:hypothetical protein